MDCATQKQKVVMLIILLSLTSLEIGLMTTCGAASDEKHQHDNLIVSNKIQQYAWWNSKFVRLSSQVDHQK